MPQPPHVPTPATRKQVETFAGHGVPQEAICTLIGVTLPTLHKYYRSELDTGMARADAIVAKRLFAMTETNVAAAIFWAKVRLGWSEKQRVEVSGPDGGPVQHTVDATAAIGTLMAQLAAAKASSSEEGEG